MIQVLDGWHVFYAVTKEDAVEQACELFECTAVDVESVTRTPHLDKYIGEDIPFLQLIESGVMWVSCPHCNVRIDDLMMDFVKNRRLEPVVVQDTHDVFCCQDCLVAECKIIEKELH